MTGIASGEVLKYNLKEAAEIAKYSNEKTAGIIGINSAARVTTIKPSGTSSCVLGTSSGIHAWHAPYYLRTQRILKNEPLYTYLTIRHPELLEDDFFNPTNQAVVTIPQKAPGNAIMRTETALDLLERVKRFNMEWVKEGHRTGDNTNNVSATISIDKNNTYPTFFDTVVDGDIVNIDEWEAVGEWMWDNRDTYNGLSVLPMDNGSYVQAPFQESTEERYNELLKSLKEIDLKNVVEIEDMTSHSQEAACAGGACVI